MDLSSLGEGLVVDCSVHRSKYLGFIKCGISLSSRENISFSRRTPLHVVSLQRTMMCMSMVYMFNSNVISVACLTYVTKIKRYTSFLSYWKGKNLYHNV